MKSISILAATLSLLFVMPASPVTLTADPLTNLPLISSSDPLHFGNEPTVLPDSPVCKSNMKADLYSNVSDKVDVTVAWYASRLSGFKKTHGYGSGRSQDSFYNADGTVMVSITGEMGKEGENTGTYSILYAKFAPGLSEKTIVSLNVQKLQCQ